MALDDPIQKLSRLTERQLEILRLRCEGREILPITFELHETESVVKQEIGRIYVKLGLDKLTRIQRFKALFEIYCPALKEAELPTPEPEPEELEPVPKEVEEMIEEDERALVPLQPKPLVPNEKRQPPPHSRGDRPDCWWASSWECSWLWSFSTHWGDCRGPGKRQRLGSQPRRRSRKPRRRWSSIGK
jgi:DNA-binding CsgD family transcriptional regulator